MDDQTSAQVALQQRDELVLSMQVEMTSLTKAKEEVENNRRDIENEMMIARNQLSKLLELLPRRRRNLKQQRRRRLVIVHTTDIPIVIRPSWRACWHCP